MEQLQMCEQCYENEKTEAVTECFCCHTKLCKEHITFKCALCEKSFDGCGTHIADQCVRCKKFFCREHMVYTGDQYYPTKWMCKKCDESLCELCKDEQWMNDVVGDCSLCNRKICASHTVFKCPKCDKRFDRCKSYCEITEKCGYCQGTFCRSDFDYIGDDWFNSICKECKLKYSE